MAVISEVVRTKSLDGKESGRAASGAVWLVYREILDGVFLILEAGFRRGRQVFSDEPRANYLISVIARGKIAVWPKDLLFLDASELFAGRALPAQLAEELAAKAGIDQDSHVWCAVSDTHPADIYRDHCFICG